MPGLVDGTADVRKRKRDTGSQKPLKRARSEDSDDAGQTQILLLENEIFESKKHYNNISTLIKLLQTGTKETDDSLVAAIALCRVFSRLIVSGDLTKKHGTTEKELVVIQWLKERYSEYKKSLLMLLASGDSASTVLTLCMRTLKVEGEHLLGGQQYSFPMPLLTDIIRTLLDLDEGEEVRREFSDKFLGQYDDIRFYSFKAIEAILREDRPHGGTGFLNNAIGILSAIESVPEEEEELEDFYISRPNKSSHAVFSLTAHKKHAQGAWLACLKTKMDKEQRKNILGVMSSTIAPWFIKPELLMDFLTDSYNAGGSTSLQALSGVFYLIQERNLDYPSFYRKLYSLLDKNILHSKHRSKFFRLLDTFMSSTHLPAALVASFIKRLSRLAIHAPPSGTVAVVPWIYNLLKKHPTCTFMIHREVLDSEAKTLLENIGMEDPFLVDEENPMETNAIESSLWEIVMLQSHYHPNVAMLAKIMSEQFTKNAYNLEDFLDHSYGSMLDAELSKEVKKAPVVEYAIPKRILKQHEAGSGIEDSLLVKLWDFS